MRAGVSLTDGFWFYWQRFTCTTFLVLVGVSMTIVYRRERERQGPQARIPEFFWRGLRIFGWGPIITVVVWVAGQARLRRLRHPAPHRHLDHSRLPVPALQMAQLRSLDRLLPPRQGDSSRCAGMGMLHRPGELEIGNRLGFRAAGWRPSASCRTTIRRRILLIPWFGVVLLGIWFGNWFYADNRRRVPLPDWSGVFPVTFLVVPGRGFAAIYLIHQPLLLLLLIGGHCALLNRVATP